MVASKLSDCFKFNFIHLKLLGVWPGDSLHRHYKYYSTFFLFIVLFIYDTLLIVNFMFTPPEIEEIIEEVVFIFTEITVMGKVFMVLLMREKLFAAFDVLDCEAFKGEDRGSREIVERHVSKYKKGWKMYVTLGNISYFGKVLMPILMHFIFNTKMELPTCKYNFLDDGLVRRYFAFWFIYQSGALYCHLQYNLNIDTLIAGLLYMAIAQVKMLKHELKNLRVVKVKSRVINDNAFNKEDALQIILLNKYLKHYEMLLNYCNLVQNIIGVTMFIQFSMASVMICIVLCRLLLPWTADFLLFVVTYLCAIILQIFVPSWLGTELSYESAELVSAAYSSEWIPRSERFKQSLKLFMTRATTSIVMTGWRIVPLSLDTFISMLIIQPSSLRLDWYHSLVQYYALIGLRWELCNDFKRFQFPIILSTNAKQRSLGPTQSSVSSAAYGSCIGSFRIRLIMKLAYSFFTLIRNFQDPQET